MMSNIGMLSMITAFAVPWLAGLNGTLGGNNGFEACRLNGQFCTLGHWRGVFGRVLKTHGVAISKKGNYQRNVGTLAFKQVFGNSLNCCSQRRCFCVAGADWSAFFPVYMAGSVAAFMLYNKFRMKEQTLVGGAGQKEIQSKF